MYIPERAEVNVFYVDPFATDDDDDYMIVGIEVTALGRKALIEISEAFISYEDATVFYTYEPPWDTLRGWPTSEIIKRAWKYSRGFKQTTAFKFYWLEVKVTPNASVKPRQDILCCPADIDVLLCLPYDDDL